MGKVRGEPLTTHFVQRLRHQPPSALARDELFSARLLPTDSTANVDDIGPPGSNQPAGGR
jgi:hypothetical protein